MLVAQLSQQGKPIPKFVSERCLFYGNLWKCVSNHLNLCRLLVGPLTVHINSSAEPLERGVKATIPELEAEMTLMVTQL